MTISKNLCKKTPPITLPHQTSYSKTLCRTTATFLTATTLVSAQGDSSGRSAADPILIYPNLLRQDDTKASKKDESTASLGVWGYFNKVFQEKAAEKGNGSAAAAKSDETNTPELRPAPPSANPIEPNAPSKVKKIEEQREKIVPHKASYTITLDKSYDDISDAAGEMSINVFDTGDGYVFEQNSTLIIYNSDGEAEQIMTNLATWQDYAGDRYRFTSRTVRNGEEEDIIKGEAVKNHSTRTAEVTYQLPTATTISIPYTTIFPLHHILNTLDAAKKGLPSISHPVFDGSNETYEAVTVDTLLGAPKPSNLKIKVDGNINVQTKWPMRISVYPLDSPSAEPEYEMTQHILTPGIIIKDMTLDYGLFAVKAELNHVLFYDEPEVKEERRDCGNEDGGIEGE